MNKIYMCVTRGLSVSNAIAVVALSINMASSAYACCGDGEIAARGAKAAGSTVSAAISSATSTIVTWLERINLALERGFNKLYVEMNKQTAAQRVLEQGARVAQAQMMIEKAKAEAALKYELSPRTCFETAGAAASGQATAQTLTHLDNLNRDFTKRTLFTPNAAAAMAQIYTKHTVQYCSQQDFQLGRCNKPVAASLQNADVRADSMLNTTHYNSAQLDAAHTLINHLTNPVPTQPIPKAWEKTPQGKAFVAAQYIEQSRASVAANSLSHAVALRTPIKGLGSSAMLNKADVSELELMESQVRARFTSPVWYKMIAGFSLENLMREQNKMQALKLWMDLKSFQQMERIEAVLATQLALDVKRDAATHLAQARNVAAKAGR